MKHSNSPWFITKTDTTAQSFGFGYRIENKTNMSYLASVNGIAENETCKANARLMAAAPDLLEACILLKKLIHGEPTEEKIQAYKLAELAIKKAIDNE